MWLVLTYTLSLIKIRRCTITTVALTLLVWAETMLSLPSFSELIEQSVVYGENQAEKTLVQKLQNN